MDKNKGSFSPEQQHQAQIALCKLALACAGDDRPDRRGNTQHDRERCLETVVRIIRHNPRITHTNLGLPEELFRRLSRLVVSP